MLMYQGAEDNGWVKLWSRTLTWELVLQVDSSSLTVLSPWRLAATRSKLTCLPVAARLSLVFSSKSGIKITGSACQNTHQYLEVASDKSTEILDKRPTMSSVNPSRVANDQMYRINPMITVTNQRFGMSKVVAPIGLRRIVGSSEG